LTELTTLSSCEMVRTRDQQMATFPDVVGLCFSGHPLLSLGAFLRLGAPPTSAPASAGFGMPTPQAPHRIEDAPVDVLEDVKDAQLMAGVGP
jgi:hypothetical protein